MYLLLGSIIKKLLYGAIFLIATALFSQNNKITYATFSKQDGLELDEISAMAFDDDGFLWLGGKSLDTRKIIANPKRLSIQRFNGLTFDSFELPQTNEPIVNVSQIVKRDDGKFYIVGEGIFSLFNPLTQEFTLVPSISEHTSTIFEYKNKRYVLTQEESVITLQILNDDLSLTKVFSFTSGKNKYLVEEKTKIIFSPDKIAISDDNFPLLFFDWEGKLLKEYPFRKYFSEKKGQDAYFLMDEVFYREDKVYVFVLNNRQLHEIDFEKLQVTPVEIPNTYLQEETIYSYGNEDEHLVLHTHKQDLNFSTFSENGFITQTVSDVLNKPVGIKCASQDISKEIWVGTSDGNLHYFKFPSNKIKVLLPENELRAIIPLKKGQYLICTEGSGWFIFNEETKDIKPYKRIFNGTRELLPNFTKNAIIEKDYIWYNGNGFYQLNRKTNQTTLYGHYPVSCFEPLNDETYIYGTLNYNLMSFNKKITAHEVLVKTDTLSIYDIAIHENIVMGATDKGALKYNTITKKAAFYTSDYLVGDTHLLMVDYQEPFGFVFGSRDGTISTFDEASQNFSVIYKDELEAGIAKIVYDDRNLWISTFNGLVCYNSETKKAQRFSTKDGLSNNEGNRYSGLKTEKGILIGSLKGLNYFDPKMLKPEVSNSQLKLLKQVKYDVDSKKLKKEYNQNILGGGDVVELPAEHRELEISFALTNNVTENEHTYQYKLNTNDWVSLGKEQTIRFINLASGTYDLEIKAQDFSGNKIGESLKLKIEAKNFFYKTGWFYLLITAAIISLLLYFLFQSRKRQAMQIGFTRDLLTSQEKERKRIAKELHDSVGQQLTLIKKKSQKQDQEEITHLTNKILEEVRSISRGLYPPNLKLFGLTGSIEQLLYDIDEQTNLFCSVDLEDVDAYFDEEQTLNIYRFIQESVSNILKHANATAVSVFLEKSKEQVVVTVSDNGDGFEVQDKIPQNSLGIKTLKERILALGGSLNIESTLKKGTKLTAKIPYNEKRL